MCGIVGYAGNKKALNKILTGLKSLEYRGYDSAGIAYIKDDEIKIIKKEGPIKNLEENINYDEDTNIGISHTRWATHGEANDINAHPHRQGKITLVHNGIIENYDELKKELTKKGYVFKSGTDTEVAAAVIDDVYNKEKDMIKVLNKITHILKGSYAFNIINDDYKDVIFGIRKDSPLIVGIGDNENVYHSNVFLVFATTEDPKKALLKTLLRRIPIQIHIPSLEQRGLKEKADLIVYLLEYESKQIQKEIRISSLAYQTLLNTVFEGNVGELENCIRQTCMTALFMNKNKEYIEINNLHLPNTLNFANRTISFMEHHVLTIDQLKEESKKDTDKTVLKEVDKWTVKLQNNEILIDEYFDHIYLHVSKQINQILFSDQSELYASNINIIDSLKAIIEMVNQKYRCNLKDKDINVICMYLVDYFSNYSTYSKLNTDSYDVFIGLIKKYYVNEYKLVSAMNELIESHLNLYVNEFFLSCLALYLSKALTLSEQQQRVGVILAHGYATASSIASSVNEMLGQYVFEAIDMPLDTTTDQILVKLKSFRLNRYIGDMLIYSTLMMSI